MPFPSLETVYKTASQALGLSNPQPPVMPETGAPGAPLPADTLKIGNRYFSQIRELAEGIKPEDAAKLTVDNGLDEIYFTTEDGKSYVAFMEKGDLGTVRANYFGRFNDKRVKVIAVEDETNTFREGVGSVWHWCGQVLNTSFGTEATKSVSSLATTAVGSFVAAAALKSTTQAAPAVSRGALLGSVRGAFSGVVNTVVNTMASVVLFGGAAIGFASLVRGLQAQNKRTNMTTIDMVTGRY